HLVARPFRVAVLVEDDGPQLRSPRRPRADELDVRPLIQRTLLLPLRERPRLEWLHRLPGLRRDYRELPQLALAQPPLRRESLVRHPEPDRGEDEPADQRWRRNPQAARPREVRPSAAHARLLEGIRDPGERPAGRPSRTHGPAP